MLTEAQRLLVSLIAPETRRDHARQLAHALGAGDLILFVEDEEVHALLPALGFPQTLPQARRWRAFLRAVVEAGYCRDRIAAADDAVPLDVTGLVAPDGSVLALIDGAPRIAQTGEILPLVPLLARSLRAEQARLAAAGHAQAARTAATQAHALAAKLSETRLELQQALAAAEQATRAKDDFLAVVSHELRTPLNAILGWTQLARLGALDREGLARALETIERNAKTQARLIEDILDLSRIVSGRLRLNVQPVDLAATIEATLEVMRPAAEAKGVRLQALLSSPVGPISGDADRLQQVLWNLLSNAIAHTPRDGRIQVRLQRVNSHVEVAIADTGAGLSADDLTVIFERFRQVDNSSTRQHKGLGLGLAIARHLVELHGGTIVAASPGKGQGATFTVRLPLSVVHPAEPAYGALHRHQDTGFKNASLKSLQGVRVLIVDDEPDARELLTTVLTQSGAEVISAPSAASALEQFKVALPHVLISDIEMPGEDGYTLMRKIRALSREQGGSVPAIALTAYAGPADRLRVLDAGYQLHMIKPVETAELVAVIHNLTRQ